MAFVAGWSACGAKAFRKSSSVPRNSGASSTRGSRLHWSYSSSAPASVTVLSPITCWFVNKRRKPSMVKRQNRSAASPMDAYQRAAGTCCGCWSQVSASQTLMSTKYEVVGRLRVGAFGSGPAFPFEEGQRHTLAPA